MATSIFSPFCIPNKKNANLLIISQLVFVLVETPGVLDSSTNPTITGFRHSNLVHEPVFSSMDEVVFSINSKVYNQKFTSFFQHVPGRASGKCHHSSEPSGVVCLPEKYIYGWLFGIRSNSESLKKYKLECYDILYHHFHGRMSALTERVNIDNEIARLKNELGDNEKYIRLAELERKKKRIGNSLNKMDKDLVKGQLSLKVG